MAYANDAVSLAAVTNLLLTGFEWRLLPWNPMWIPYRTPADGLVAGVPGAHWDVAIAARTFWVNWILFLINVVLVGFPLDGGRLLQSVLWPKYGFRQATFSAVVMGFVCFLALTIASIYYDSVLPFLLGIFMYVTCRQQWILLETGGEESVFGYDFSQGYTSLESASSRSRRRRQNPWQRWLHKRAERRMQREQEHAKPKNAGWTPCWRKSSAKAAMLSPPKSLRFLKRVSDRYRNRQ